jgi:hypothetical protein
MSQNLEIAQQRTSFVYEKLTEVGLVDQPIDDPDIQAEAVKAAIEDYRQRIEEAYSKNETYRSSQLARAAFLEMYITGEDKAALDDFLSERTWAPLTHERHAGNTIEKYRKLIGRLSSEQKRYEEPEDETLSTYDTPYDHFLMRRFITNAGLRIPRKETDKQALCERVIQGFLSVNDITDESVLHKAEVVITHLMGIYTTVPVDDTQANIQSYLAQVSQEGVAALIDQDGKFRRTHLSVATKKPIAPEKTEQKEKIEGTQIEKRKSVEQLENVVLTLFEGNHVTKNQAQALMYVLGLRPSTRQYTDDIRRELFKQMIQFRSLLHERLADTIQTNTKGVMIFDDPQLERGVNVVDAVVELLKLPINSTKLPLETYIVGVESSGGTSIEEKRNPHKAVIDSLSHTFEEAFLPKS